MSVALTDFLHQMQIYNFCMLFGFFFRKFYNPFTNREVERQNFYAVQKKETVAITTASLILWVGFFFSRFIG